MTFSAKCSIPRLAALVTAASLLVGCGTGSSDRGVGIACPPVVEYGAELQSRAAIEVEKLPEGSALTDMLSDYAVIRDQACAGPGRTSRHTAYLAPSRPTSMPQEQQVATLADGYVPIARRTPTTSNPNHGMIAHCIFGPPRRRPARRSDCD